LSVFQNFPTKYNSLVNFVDNFDISDELFCVDNITFFLVVVKHDCLS